MMTCQRRREIIETVNEKMDGKFCVLEYPSPNPHADYQALRKMLVNTKQKVSIRKGPGKITIYIHRETYVRKLERLLGECVLHVDDERLYEEIIDAIYTKV